MSVRRYILAAVFSCVLLGGVFAEGGTSSTGDRVQPVGSSVTPKSSLPGQRIEEASRSYLRFTIPEASIRPEGSPPPAIRVTYTHRRLGHTENLLRLHQNGSSTTLRLLPRFGTHHVYLYPSLSGPWPDTLDIEVSENTDIIDLRLASIPEPERGIPADAGTMLVYGTGQWRNPDYEIFQWNLAPTVYVYVTRDYDVQARIFKRLAFFVEKPGFTGSLHRNEVIEHRHGWNAHDYRAEDLARFFRKAREENFKLNPEEENLLTMLLSNGILKNQDGTIQPAGGSVLSISLETPLALRTKFLVHEAFHGLFFTSPRFRVACLDSWRALSAAEQDFWTFFLRHRTYNVENKFLLVNEFMAFLMQQPKNELDWYYKDFIADELKAAYPARAAEFDRFYSDYPDTFHLSAARVERAAETLFGVRAGDLNCLVY